MNPDYFLFNSPNGACESCDGLGFKEKFDPELIIGNEELSLKDGVILPLNKNNQFYREFTMEIAKHCNVDPLVKWKKLSSENKNKIFYGDGKIIDFYNSYTGWSYNKIFNGVLGFLENKLKRSDLWQREELGKYLTKFECEACGGSRLKKEAMSIKINKCDINFISQLSIEKALIWFKDLDNKLTSYQKEIASNIIKEIIDRLSFLNNVGLNYLQLSRSSSTLSGEKVKE